MPLNSISGMADSTKGMEKVVPYNQWNAQRVPATSYTMTGPTSGSVSVASSPFTIALPAGPSMLADLVVTMADGGAGGTFTPTTVRLSDTDRSKTFTYTPNATPATKVISVTNSVGLTNPANISYVAS